MIDKTIKLAGEYPSDFKPSVSVQEVQLFFEAYKFFDGRMIGGSKTGYRDQHPDDLIVFNANCNALGNPPFASSILPPSAFNDLPLVNKFF